MKKNWLMILMGTMLAIGLAACGGGNNADNNGGESVSDAEQIAKKNCLSCHGDNLEGRNGPPLENIGSELTKEEILTVIEEGRPGMPGNLIKGDDAEKVAQWLSEKK